jgi:MtrB/PioB family decaheme-associated outer membrane protein
MNMKNDTLVFSRSFIAAAVALAFPSGSALADDVQDLINPNVSDVSLRIQDLNKVNPLYRYYSGLNDSGVNGSLDVNLINRNADGGWLKFQARDLGLSGIQEAGASYEKQGDWRIGLDYNEITKYAPYTIDTKVGGVGSNTLNLNQDFRSFNGIGPESSLKLERTATSLSGSKFFSDSLKASFSFKTEDKTGAIMSSSNGNTWSGLTPANAGVPAAGKNYATMFFAPQPENYKHNQFSASIDYFTKTFQLTGGYYGSFFNNTYNALNITPGTDPAATGALASSQVPWISLPPDNHSQQGFLTGAYSFTDSTRATFKLSKARAVQEDSFIPNSSAVGANPPGVAYAPGITNTNLGGLIDTTTYAGKVTSRLTKDLDLLASWRYEDRDDKTPIQQYVTGFSNIPQSHTTNNGKVELSYRLPDGYRLTGGVDYDQRKIPLTPETEGLIREETHETTTRIDLRKSMSETINGSVTLAHGERTGGAWNSNAVGSAALAAMFVSGVTSFPTATNVTAPIQFSDRTRDKAKLMVDWNPTEPLSLQLYYEHGEDSYTSGPMWQVPGYTLSAMGLLSGKTDLVGLDAAYAINDVWKLNGYYSYNQNKTHQNEVQTPRGGIQTCAGGTLANTCVPWTADLDMKGEVLGAGLKGAVGRWDLGAKYLYSKDTTSYGVAADPGTMSASYSPVPAGAGSVPNTTYTLNRVQLTGTYAYSKATKLRLDYMYDNRKMDDYTWANWTYSDGTKVNVAPNQTTQLVGVTVIQSF